MRVTVYVRPECLLCTRALAVVSDVCADLGVNWEEIDITGDPELVERFQDEVPAVYVDGQQVGFWSVNPDLLRAALA